MTARAAMLGRTFATHQLDDLGITGSAASGGTATADMLLDADGGRRKFQSTGAGGSTSEASPHWSSIHPNETNTWHARLVSLDSGSNRYVGSPTLGTWTEITGPGAPTFDYSWSPGGGPQGPDVSTYTIAISDDAGSTTHDTMTLTVTLSIDAP